MARVRRTYDIRSNALDKQSEKEKRSKIYSTKIIDEIMKDKTGKQDMNPFWHGQTNYRDSGIMFEYTDEEREELEKCANSCLYFVEHYAKFKNDKGHTLVKLRDYQVRLLNLMGAERYDEISDTIIPKHQKIILMQSRQSGKCVTGNTLVNLKTANANMVENNNEQKYNIMSIIKNMIKHYLK